MPQKEQPFWKASQADLKADDKFIIKPYYWTGTPSLPYTEFTIDCLSEYEPSQVSSENPTFVDHIKSTYNKHGLIYLKNTGKTEYNEMLDLSRIVMPQENQQKYEGGSNWRNTIESNVYDTGAPRQAWIHYHHEMAYVGSSPKQIAFLCKHAPEGKGYTYVSYSNGHTGELMKSELGQKLKEKGICYVRCLSDR
jgi:hypothetical protein